MKKQITFLFFLFTLLWVNAQQSAQKLIPFENNSSRTETHKRVVDPGDKKDNTIVVKSLTNNKLTKNRPDNPASVKKSGGMFKAINQFPWNEGFEGETFPPAGWALVDKDADGYNWSLQSIGIDGKPFDYEGHSGDHAAGSASYLNGVGALSPENWLITPALELPAESVALTYWVAAEDGNYPADHYEVMISTTGIDPADFTSVFEETLTTNEWLKRTIPLDAYAQQTIYIAFVHNQSYDQYIMKIDDVTVGIPVSTDAEVLAVTSPVSGIDLTNEETVKVRIKNNGRSDIQQFSVQLSVNGSAPVAETYTGTIAPDAEVEYTFTAKADLSAAGEHTITVSVVLPGDQVADNDSKTITIKNTVCNTVSVFPYTAEFENADEMVCWTMESDDANPALWSIGTGAAGGGKIQTAHTGTGNLIFGQSSSTEYKTKLVLPGFDLTAINNPFLNFWFAAEVWDGDQNELRVFYKTSVAGTWTQIFESTSNVDKWTYVTLELPSPSAEYYIAFEGTSKYGRKIVIDDVRVGATIMTDAGIISINAPNHGPNLSAAQSVNIKVKNYGKNAITSLPVEVLLNGESVLSETITDNIPAGWEYTYTFSGTIDLSAVHTYKIEVKTNLQGDESVSNDKLIKYVENYGNYAIMGSDSEVTSCNIGFADDGVNDGYIPGVDETQTITFHPANAGDRIKVEFTELIISEYYVYAEVFHIPGDTLFVYEGTQADQAHLRAYYSGDYTNNLPVITSYSADGALTFVFKKSSGNSAAGWKAQVSCRTIHPVDMEVTDIATPVVVTGTAIVPTVKIRNEGLSEASAWSVSLSDGGAYTSTVAGTTAIPVGGELAVTMDEWIVTAASSANLTATVIITGDGDLTNNELVKSIPALTYADAYTANALSTRTYMMLDLTSGDVTSAGDYVSEAFPSGEDYDGEYIYRISAEDDSFGRVYPNGLFEKLGTITGLADEDTPSGLAYDWDNDIWYMGAIHEVITDQIENYFRLYTLNIADFTATLVGTSTSQCFNRGLDMAGGYLYSVSTLNSNLIKIDPADASVSYVGDTGLSLSYGQDVSYDMVDNKLYTIAFDYIDQTNVNARFGTYDLSTGAFTEIKDHGYDQFATICITKTLTEKTPVGDNVQKDAVVSVTFGNNIAAADLSKIIIYPNPGNVAGSVANKVLTIAHDDFAYETEYTVIIPAGTLTGYAKPVSWSFTTEPDPADINSTETSDITLYPNPAHTVVKLSGIPENSDITLHDIFGRVVKQYKATMSELDINIDFESGTYFVKVTKGDSSVVKKLIVK